MKKMNKNLQKKVRFIYVSIITGCIVFLSLVAGLIILHIYYNGNKKSNNLAIKNIHINIQSIKNKINNLEQKLVETKKYQNIWEQIEDNKKTLKGANIDEVNTTFNLLVDKFLIKNPNINISLPEKIENKMYDRANIQVFFSKIIIDFQAIDDTKALIFIENFIKEINGYIVITNLRVTLDGKKNYYNEKELIALSKGKKIKYLIRSSVTLSWYILKEKIKQ